MFWLYNANKLDKVKDVRHYVSNYSYLCIDIFLE